MTTPHPTFRIAVRLLAAMGLAAGLWFLFTRAFVPDGRLSVTTDFVDPAPYVSQPKPSERLAPAEPGSDGRPRTQMIGDPVFVDFTPPSRFDAVTLSLTYENSGHPVVEVGALASAIDEQFDLRPVENRIIDGIPWKRVTSGSLTLLERHDRYASVDDFFRDPPERNRVATYRTEAPIPYRLPGYVPATSNREIEVSLRGHHRLLVYAKDEPLNLSLVVQDMNRQDGADPVIVSVYKGDAKEPVVRTILPDDGNTSDDQRSSKLRTIPVSLTAPEEGFYQIEFTASADVFIRKIVTRQRKLVFLDKLYLGDHVGYSDKTPPLTVYTNGSRIAARTAHAESVQTITVGGDRLAIDLPNLKYAHAVKNDGLTPVATPKRDVLLETDGLFALSKDDYFDPLPYPMEWYRTQADLDARHIDFVLAAYEPPRMDGDLRTGTVTFDTASLAKTKEGAYRFVITAPGIGETRQQLKLASLTFSLRREPITLRNAIPLLFAAFRPAKPSEPPVVTNGTTYGESPP